MAGVLDLWHVASGKRIAKKDKRTARDLKSIIPEMKELEKKIIRKGGDIDKGLVRQTKEHVIALLNDIQAGFFDLTKISDDTLKQYYDLIKRVGEIEKRLENLQGDYSAQLKGIKKLKEKIVKHIMDARRDIQDEANNNQKAFKYAHMLGAVHVANLIKRTERGIRKEIKQETALEEDILHEEEEKRVKDDVEEFLKLGDVEAEKLEDVEHDDVIEFFYVRDKLMNVFHILSRLEREKYPSAEEDVLKQKAVIARNMMEKAVDEVQRIGIYLEKKAKSLT